MARLITGEVIASYPQLTTPDEKGKYSITLIFDGGFPKNLKKAALDTIKAEYAGKLAGAKIVVLDTNHGKANFLQTPDGLTIRVPWRDDAELVAKKGYPEGSAFIAVRGSKGGPQPQVVSEIPDPNNDGKPTVIDAGKIYAGCIVKASIDPFCYDTDGNQGVTFGLGNIQFIRDGDRLDGRTFGVDDFDADENAVADLSDLTGDEDEELAGVAAGDDGDDLSDLLG